MSFGQELPPSGLYTRVLRKIEFPLITAALAATRGNQIRAADLLGLNRNTLRKKIRDLGIKVIRTPGPVAARNSGEISASLAPVDAVAPHLCSCRQSATL